MSNPKCPISLRVILLPRRQSQVAESIAITHGSPSAKGDKLTQLTVSWEASSQRVLPLTRP